MRTPLLPEAADSTDFKGSGLRLGVVGFRVQGLGFRVLGFRAQIGVWSLGV